MKPPLKISKYTLGMGDRFAHQASAQLQACILAAEDVRSFVARHAELAAGVAIQGIERPFAIGRAEAERLAGKYLLAVQEAGKVFRHILGAKGDAAFVTEVSMDETDSPQTAPELLVILAAIADEGIPIQTIAPKFTGRFNKGVDYATVIDIDRAKLPSAAEVAGWTSEQYVRALRHNQADPWFNPDLRQLLHVGFKVAAKMGPRYLRLLEECADSVARNVTTNLFERHLKPLFI